jgi:hypothetical protein
VIGSRSRAGIAPTPTQRLLLRAALLEGEAGRQAWEAWRRESDVERVDPGSQRLLPQLYRNVRTYAERDPLLERLKGVYRHTWSANNVLFHEAGRLLRALAQAEVRTLVLDGIALVTSYYRDQGARAVDSIVIMIPPDDLPKAAHTFAAEGWDAGGLLRSPPPGRYSSQARVLGGRRPVDLLWDPFPEGCDPDIRRTCWTGAEPAVVAEAACQRLAPAEELLRICVRAGRWEALPPFRRLADALVLLRAAGTSLDWDRFARQALRSRVVLPVRASLMLLREVLDAPVPDSTLRQLQNAPVGAGDWLEQRLSEGPRPALGRLPDLLSRYRRLAGAEATGVRESGFVRYLQGAWDVRRAWQLPVVAMGKGLRRVLGPRSGGP